MGKKSQSEASALVKIEFQRKAPPQKKESLVPEKPKIGTCHPQRS